MKTQKYCVIGNPIAHSLSPQIYNFLFKKYDINATYSAEQVLPEKVCEFVEFAKKELSGFNVTIPHKSSIINELDFLEQSATLFESVNTVVNKEGKLQGHSTDAQGFELSLFEFGKKIEGQKIVVLGSGGASNAITLVCAKNKPDSLCVASRNERATTGIKQLVSRKTELKDIVTSSFEKQELEKVCKGATLVVNTTPLGMENFGKDFENFEFLDVVDPDAAVYDIVYKPRKTNLITAAKQKKLQTIDGLGMLIWQAFAAFEIYTGILPERCLKKDVEKILCL